MWVTARENKGVTAAEAAQVVGRRLYRQYAPPYLFVFLKPDLWQPATGLPDTKGHVVLVYLHYTVYYSKARWLARGIGSQIQNRYGV